MKPSFLSIPDSGPSTWLRTGFWLDVVRWSGILCLLLPGLSGCWGSADNRLVARPAGPYQLTLDLGSTLPQAGQETILTFHLTHTKTQQPVSDLQILHERALHTFIVSRDLSTFVHTHHEDYIPLTDQDLQRARFHFPYTFPKAGQYLIVNEFTHKDRSWTKHFTLTVTGEPGPPPEPVLSIVEGPDFRQEKQFGAYRVALRTSPSPPIAGHEVEIVCHLTSVAGVPVGNLGLYLGTEVHMASWRLDGEHFGHQHTYTSEMARFMEGMRGHRMSSDQMARRMVQLMSRPAKQEYVGPDVPLHHVFPTAGVYKVFLELAPNGEYLLVDFLVTVAEYTDDADTTIQSILPESALSARPAKRQAHS